jgi:hypothetical protein
VKVGGIREGILPLSLPPLHHIARKGPISQPWRLYVWKKGLKKERERENSFGGSLSLSLSSFTSSILARFEAGTFGRQRTFIR